MRSTGPWKRASDLFVVDTNLLIYAAIEESAEHDRVQPLLEQWRSGPAPCFLTWPIIYEFLRTTTHPRVFRNPLKLSAAWSFVDALTQSPAVDVLVAMEHHGEVLSQLTREYPRVSGNLLHDLHTVALMREHGVTEIRTADTDFHQFTFLRVSNPLSS
jgi:hypothetical protein